MLPTTSFEFGDIALVPFPFTDQSTAKKRPAVIISSKTYNTERPDVIIMAVTSQIRPIADFDIPVRDWQAAGLLKPSVIKPVIATIEQGLVIKKLGRLGRGLQSSGGGVKDYSEVNDFRLPYFKLSGIRLAPGTDEKITVENHQQARLISTHCGGFA